MEIGAEISQKIRSAIKAKLIELGAYDDDELPDYIMVMVANKKTQKEMTNDLSLFLNTNTGKFTSWLHGLLKKLQTINAAEPSSSKPKAKEKEKHKGEKKKHRSSQGEEKHRSSQGEKVKSSKAPEAAEKVLKEGGKEERPRRVSSGDAERLNKVAAGEKRRSLEEVTKPRHPESAPADELSIDENTDEFREEAKEIAKREQTKAPSTGKPPPPKVAKSDRSVDVKRSSRPPSLDTVKARPSSSTSRGKEHKYTQDHSDSRKKPISVVGSVKRKYELEEEDEEYDPLNPAVGSVASVVHGPSRKSSVPKALQANKSLLMKAVSEAEKSVTKTKHEQEHHKTSPKLERRPVDMRHRLKTAAGQQLMSRSKRKELEMMVRTVDSEKDQVKKPHRPSGDFESIRYTVKNESASQDQTYGSKMSPKSQASGMAPSRVATSALRELKKSAVIKTEVEQADSEDSQHEGSEASCDGDDESETSNEENENSDDENSDSGSEIEIEIVDRAAQTEVSMQTDNLKLLGGNSGKIEMSEFGVQTEEQENMNGDKTGKERMVEIGDSLLNLFIESLMPFEFVENEAFKGFARTLEPKYHFPKKKKLITDVGMLYNKLKDKLKGELSKCDSVVLTHKVWRNTESELYDTIWVYFISEDWHLRKAVLRTSHIDHVAVNIAECLEETKAKWGIYNATLVTGDTEIERKLKGLLSCKDVTCFGSCINYVVKSCLKDKDIHHFLQQGETLVEEILKNTQACEVFEKKKEVLLAEDVRKKSLCLHDGHTWTSLLDMISVLSQQTPALHAAIMDSELTNQGIDIRNLLYAINDQSILESLVKILTPFKTATEILTRSDVPTLQKVIPIFVKLEKVLEVRREDDVMIKSMKISMRQTVEKCLHSCRDTCLLACLVHPQTKQMAFVSQKEKDNVKNLLFMKVKSVRSVTAKAKQSESSSVPLLSITVENDWLDDVICVADDRRSPDETAKIELNLYMAEPACSRPPLEWWREKAALYPHIAGIARRVLAIPASSVDADEVFMLNSTLVAKHLNLKAEHVDQMIFLKQNKHLYHKAFEVYGPIVPDTRLVQCADRGLDVKLKSSARNDESPDPEIQQLLEEAQETMLDLNDDLMYEEFKTKLREGSGSESPAEPRFIVTLDGVNPASYTAIPEAKVQPVQSVKPVQKTPVEAPKPEVPEPAAIKQLQPPKIRPFNISLKDTDDEEEMEEETSPVSAEPAQVLERCRFWPACANGNSCVYIHPSIPCKTFPYCKFGDKCIYIHPNCRFDASCTRHDCPYTHSGKRAHGSTIIHKTMPVWYWMHAQGQLSVYTPRPSWQGEAFMVIREQTGKERRK
ncbi:ZC3HE-like protein [Mya arenaria]|uniref:ZC3HE-like protein n=1 Tax=Mya arenaria TaxID=6604 RepID=A0ABY7FC11_MYAAR|nr:ZC3HE-like protein [Mya arenaria]